jgi:hypothetical protein
MFFSCSTPLNFSDLSTKGQLTHNFTQNTWKMSLLINQTTLRKIDKQISNKLFDLLEESYLWHMTILYAKLLVSRYCWTSRLSDGKIGSNSCCTEKKGLNLQALQQVHVGIKLGLAKTVALFKLRSVGLFKLSNFVPSNQTFTSASDFKSFKSSVTWF